MANCNQLGKGPIESGMFSDGSDTIPVHVPVQGTQLSRTAKRWMSIFCRPLGHLRPRHPKERGQSQFSLFMPFQHIRNTQ